MGPLVSLAGYLPAQLRICSMGSIWPSRSGKALLKTGKVVCQTAPGCVVAAAAAGYQNLAPLQRTYYLADGARQT